MHVEMKDAFKVLIGKLDGRGHLGDQGIHGITLNCILKEWSVSVWTGFI